MKTPFSNYFPTQTSFDFYPFSITKTRITALKYRWG